MRLIQRLRLPRRITIASLVAVLKSRAVIPVVMVCLGASVFAGGLNNFQTVFADDRGLNYANFFLIYTLTVIIFRLVLVKFKGGTNPYLMIAALQCVMCASVVLFIFSGGNTLLYALVAVFVWAGVRCFISNPCCDGSQRCTRRIGGPQTLQLFALTYFVGIFGFPFIAGWIIVEIGTTPLLVLVAVIAAFEASMALRRATTFASV